MVGFEVCMYGDGGILFLGRGHGETCGSEKTSGRHIRSTLKEHGTAFRSVAPLLIVDVM